eukprot:TRINITY_DN5008_c0_g2_i1.p1 TRINITY_DN5008_c0_g2~~TRINITY_DN5008_c0_g2_i1.p1  ORF type:complete len:192 (-),score=47.72 TRINITY_DN5008_c0_g2_i1:63-638(-)
MVKKVKKVKTVKKDRKVPKAAVEEEPEQKIAEKPDQKAKANTQRTVEETAQQKEEKEKLAKEAVADILRGISKRDVRKSGRTYIPADWALKYKRVLGSYKMFVSSQKDTFALDMNEKGTFFIKKVGDTSTPAPAPVAKVDLDKASTTWQKELEKAWETYCSATPKKGRSFELFCAVLPKTVRDTKLAEASA